MKVHELMELLRGCNQEASVSISMNMQIGDYTCSEEHCRVTGILPWPEPAETANVIELTYESPFEES